MRSPRHQSPPAPTGKPFRRGLSLLEVVLSLTIFLGAFAALSGLASSGMNAAVQARLKTHAVLRCESKLAELAALVEPLEPAVDMPFQDDPSWSWSMESVPGPHVDLLLITVTVNYTGQSAFNSTSHSISRLIRNPVVFEEAAAAASDSASGSTSSTGSGS